MLFSSSLRTWQRKTDKQFKVKNSGVFLVNCRGHNTEQKYINLLVAKKEQRSSRVGTNPARGCSSSVIQRLPPLTVECIKNWLDGYFADSGNMPSFAV